MNIWLLFTLIVELFKDVLHICTQQMSSRDVKLICKTLEFRVIFRTILNIYVGAFCAKRVVVFHPSTIFAKSPIVDIWHGVDSTLWKFILHIVYLLKRFYIRKLKIWIICASAIRDYSLIHTIKMFFDMILVRNFYCGCHLINGI